MPITVSYDLAAADTNERNYIRSMFERFCWDRLGGSVFRYSLTDETGQEDWLNDVIPALMIFRSYCIARNITVRYFTLDASSVTRIDASDPAAIVGSSPRAEQNLYYVILRTFSRRKKESGEPSQPW
jgi:hypothetical protein